MKKLIITASALLLVLSMSACGNETKKITDQSSTQTAQTSAASEYTTAKPTSGRIVRMSSYDIHLPDNWAKQTSASDPDSLVVFAISSAADVKKDTPRIEVKVEKSLKETANKEKFDEYVKAKKATAGKDVEIAGVKYMTGTYKDKDGNSFEFYQALVNNKIVRVEKQFVNEKIAKAMQDVVDSIRYK